MMTRTITGISHIIGLDKKYKLKLALECGHTETVWGWSHMPQLGGDQFCQACAALELRRVRHGKEETN